MLDMDLGPGECGGYAVVALRGELDLVDAAAAADGPEAVAAREPWIIVDLAGLEFIDANGVAALLRGRRPARNAGGDVLLAAPQRLVRRVLARQAVAPIRRQPARMRRQRIAMNAPLRSSAGHRQLAPRPLVDAMLPTVGGRRG
jgi:anti-anti-sigma factor